MSSVTISGEAQATPLQSFKAVAAARREVAALMASIERQVVAMGKDGAGVTAGVGFEVRRTPERCVVQAGRMGLSVSWLQPQPNTIAESALLVMEWDGFVTLHGEAPPLMRRATLLRERGLQLDTAGPDWFWRSDEAPARSFTSEELAQSCIQMLVHRVEQTAGA